MADFQGALRYVISNECPCDKNGDPIPGRSYENVPGDKGGATNFGIIQEDYSRWLGRSASVEDVQSMTWTQAQLIYKAQYWNTISLDGVQNDAVATAIFDVGVNRGIGFVARMVQGMLGLPVDGHIGPVTLSAINSIGDPQQFISDLEGKVEAGYRAIVDNKPSQSKFLAGWLNRAKRLLTLIALAATPSPKTAPVVVVSPQPIRLTFWQRILAFFGIKI